MRTLFAAILSVFLSLGHAQEKVTMEVKANQSQFEIMFPANATTGYQWTIEKYDHSFLTLKKSEYIAPVTQLKGAGGLMVYRFELIADKAHPETTEILFKYSKPWEPKHGTMKKVVVHFKS
ncbi:MAG: protease inhibitor I42 family protein [Tatlockia sp.]|jgi:inhibitor of cysteine peptidase